MYRQNHSNQTLPCAQMAETLDTVINTEIQQEAFLNPDIESERNIDRTLQSMIEGRLLMPGDTIAIGLSIFAPLPDLENVEKYGLNVEYIDAMPKRKNGKNELSFPQEEIEKLGNHSIKAFFILKDGEGYMPLSDRSMAAIHAITASENRDLMIIDENVNTDMGGDMLIVSIPGHTHTLLLNLTMLKNEIDESTTTNIRFTDKGRNWLINAG